MTLAETGLAILKKFLNKYDPDVFFRSGAFRGTLFFRYEGSDYVIKYDLDPDEFNGETMDGSCYMESEYWKKYAPTEHRKILCPVFVSGHIEEGDRHWLIMPKLKTLQEMTPDSNRGERLEYFRTVVVKDVRKLYPGLTTDGYRIYLPDGLFGGDLHYNNWAYDPAAKRWRIIDYAGDGESDEWPSDLEEVEDDY